MTTLGEGLYSGHVRVHPPAHLATEVTDFQSFATGPPALWNKGHDVLPAKMIGESVPVADTIDGDYIVLHRERPHDLYVLPRHSRHVYQLGNTLDEALDWVLNSGTLLTRG